MPSKLPLIGQTYASLVDPDLVVYVVDVSVTGDGDDAEANFIVEGCDPAYKDDTTNAYGYDFDAETWLKHEFVLVPE